MAWGTEFPVVAGSTKLDRWSCFNQLYTAGIEKVRGVMGGDCVAPYSSFPWAKGTITACTETVISTGLTFCGGTDDVSGYTSWGDPFGCSSPGTPFYETPTSYYIVIDDNDFTKCIKLIIVSYTNTGTITVAATPNGLRDYVTSKQIASVASLVGKKFYIIRGDHGIWAHERVIAWPNAYQYAAGTVREYHDDPAHPLTVTNPTLTTIKDVNDLGTRGDWSTDYLKTYQILYYGVDGYLKRATISGNTEDTITFNTQGSIPAIGSHYCVVPVNGVAVPNRDKGNIQTYYAGGVRGYLTHMPDDTMGNAYLPAKTITTPHGPAPDCTPLLMDAYDLDVYTEITIDPGDQDCSRPADYIYTRNFWKGGFRSIQLMAYNASSAFIEKKTYDSTSFIAVGNPALMHKLAGVNSFTGTTGSVYLAVGNDGSVNNQIAVSGVSMPYYPIQVFYSITKTELRDDSHYHYGRGYMPNATTLIAQTDANESYTFTQTYDGVTPSVLGDDNRTIYITCGFTRYHPLTFKRMYDIEGVFEPDIHTDTGTGIQSAIDPADQDVWDGVSNDCYGGGKWRKRPASTNYIERKHEDSSWRSPQGAAWEIGAAFADGDVARFVDDSDNSPSIYQNPPSSNTLSSFYEDGPAADYLRRFYNGQLSVQNQEVRLRQQGGKAEGGGTFYLTDTTKDWFDYQWFSGTMRIDSGTATGGSTTSITDSTKVDPNPLSPTVRGACFWLPGRFVGFSGPFVGFTIEILISGTAFDVPGAIVEKRLITSSNNTGVTANWTEPLSVSASGKKYRIKEPYRLNRYAHLPIILTDPNSVQYKTTVTGNCGDRIFFTPVNDSNGVPIVVGKGWSYDVIVPQTGTVYKRVSGQWVEAKSIADAARTGVTTPAMFHSDSTENLPTYVKRYGLYMVGDAITVPLYNELYACFNVLRWFKGGGAWSGEAVDGTPENNCGATSGNDCGTLDPTTCADTGISSCGGGPGAKAGAEAGWGASLTSCAGGQPYANTTGTFSAFGSMPCPADGCHSYSINRLYSYLQVDGICTRMACAVEYFNYGAPPVGSAVTAGCSTGTEVVFNANGDIVSNGLWRSFGSDGAAVRSTSRKKLGTAALPAGQYPSGTGSPVCHTHQEGYSVIDQATIVKFDVAGGFTYIT
jgi:hypothetical protein